MKLFYLALASSILLIWLGLFDRQPLGQLSDQQFIPAATPFTVRVVGTRLTIEAESPFTIAIDPTGYVAIWQMRDGEREWLRRWQTWPHVRESENEISAEWQAGALKIWINQELLWDDVPMTLDCPCQITTSSQTFELFLP